MNKKKVFVIMCIMCLVMTSIFASDTGLQSTAVNGYTLNLTWIKRVVNLVVGIFAGGYVLVKAGVDIFHAVKNSSEDPNGLKKAIGGLVLNIAILSAFFFVLNYVLSGVMSSNGSGTNLTTDTGASSAFFDALSGAEVVL